MALVNDRLVYFVVFLAFLVSAATLGIYSAGISIAIQASAIGQRLNKLAVTYIVTYSVGTFVGLVYFCFSCLRALRPAAKRFLLNSGVLFLASGVCTGLFAYTSWSLLRNGFVLPLSMDCGAWAKANRMNSQGTAACSLIKTSQVLPLVGLGLWGVVCLIALLGVVVYLVRGCQSRGKPMHEDEYNYQLGGIGKNDSHKLDDLDRQSDKIGEPNSLNSQQQQRQQQQQQNQFSPESSVTTSRPSQQSTAPILQHPQPMAYQSQPTAQPAVPPPQIQHQSTSSSSNGGPRPLPSLPPQSQQQQSLMASAPLQPQYPYAPQQQQQQQQQLQLQQQPMVQSYAPQMYQPYSSIPAQPPAGYYAAPAPVPTSGYYGAAPQPQASYPQHAQMQAYPSQPQQYALASPTGLPPTSYPDQSQQGYFAGAAITTTAATGHVTVATTTATTAPYRHISPSQSPHPVPETTTTSSQAPPPRPSDDRPPTYFGPSTTTDYATEIKTQR